MKQQTIYTVIIKWATDTGTEVKINTFNWFQQEVEK